ncbi:MAG: transglutaminase family protein [Nanoarchaeota archaeon]|nr:transglutaminase family protein [Nanoarchaeota archaeon]
MIFILLQEAFSIVSSSNFYYYGLPDYTGYYTLRTDLKEPSQLDFVTFPGINLKIDSYTSVKSECVYNEQEFKRISWEQSEQNFIHESGEIIIKIDVNPGTLSSGVYPNIIFINDEPKLFTVGLGKTKMIEHDNISDYLMTFFHGNSLSRNFFCGQNCAHHPANKYIQEFALKFQKDGNLKSTIEGLLNILWFSQQESETHEDQVNQDVNIAKKMISWKGTVSSCNLQSQILISSLRALGLPARNVEILKVHQNNKTYSDTSHTLVEVWLPEEGWMMIDSVGVLGFVELEDFKKLYGDRMIMLTYNECVFYDKGVIKECPKTIEYVKGSGTSIIPACFT